MTELVIGPLAPGEAWLFDSLPDPGLVGFAAFGDTYSAMADAGEYRPEWSWVALRGGVVVARAAWWGGPDDEEPTVLDWFDFIDDDAAVRLLRAVPLRTQYTLKLPPQWRGTPEPPEPAVADKILGAGVTGLVDCPATSLMAMKSQQVDPGEVGPVLIRHELDAGRVVLTHMGQTVFARLGEIDEPTATDRLVLAS